MSLKITSMTNLEYNHLQKEAVEKYGDYGLLIEELRDAANGELPSCFTEMGNLLANYRDLPNDKRDVNYWIWVLESMKNSIQKEIDGLNNLSR